MSIACILVLCHLIVCKGPKYRPHVHSIRRPQPQTCTVLDILGLRQPQPQTTTVCRHLFLRLGADCEIVGQCKCRLPFWLSNMMLGMALQRIFLVHYICSFVLLYIIQWGGLLTSVLLGIDDLVLLLNMMMKQMTGQALRPDLTSGTPESCRLQKE